MADDDREQPRLVIQNVRLAVKNQGPSELFSVQCAGGVVEKLSPYVQEKQPLDQLNVVDGGGGILLPSLCHSHIHLDKCNILSQSDQLVSGTFQEAMTVTSKAKAAFTPDDLLARGRYLISESVKYGVTSMRAHVEVDATVRFMCIEAGLRLKREFKDVCDVELAVFAQDPLYASLSDHEIPENLSLLREAAGMKGISALGSAPYVESSEIHARQNIDHVLEISMSQNLHVDFHLDYNLSRSSRPLIHYVIKRLRDLNWTACMPGKHVTIGHATRLTLFSPEELSALCDEIKGLPVTFVGLPQSDMYMMGRNDPARPRGTLQIPELVRNGFDVAMSINNIGNAFTPQGSLDPLSLCPLGVAVYQTGTPNDCGTLLEAVTIASRRAAGFPACGNIKVSQGDPADLLIVHGNDSVQSLVLNPGFERTVIKGGKIVARKTVTEFILH